MCFSSRRDNWSRINILIVLDLRSFNGCKFLWLDCSNSERSLSFECIIFLCRVHTSRWIVDNSILFSSLHHHLWRFPRKLFYLIMKISRHFFPLRRSLFLVVSMEAFVNKWWLLQTGSSGLCCWTKIRLLIIVRWLSFYHFVFIFEFKFKLIQL